MMAFFSTYLPSKARCVRCGPCCRGSGNGSPASCKLLVVEHFIIFSPPEQSWSTLVNLYSGILRLDFFKSRVTRIGTLLAFPHCVLGSTSSHSSSAPGVGVMRRTMAPRAGSTSKASTLLVVEAKAGNGSPASGFLVVRFPMETYSETRHDLDALVLVSRQWKKASTHLPGPDVMGQEAKAGSGTTTEIRQRMQTSMRFGTRPYVAGNSLAAATSGVVHLELAHHQLRSIWTLDR